MVGRAQVASHANSRLVLSTTRRCSKKPQVDYDSRLTRTPAVVFGMTLADVSSIAGEWDALRCNDVTNPAT